MGNMFGGNNWWWIIILILVLGEDNCFGGCDALIWILLLSVFCGCGKDCDCDRDDRHHEDRCGCVR